MGFFKVELGGDALQTHPKRTTKLAVTREELARIGVPARKITRVMAELQKAAERNHGLNRKSTLLAMADTLQGLFL